MYCISQVVFDGADVYGGVKDFELDPRNKDQGKIREKTSNL